MPSFRDAFPSEWLKKEDLQNSGPKIAVITAVGIEQVGQGQNAEHKLVAHMEIEGQEKKLSLNMTNANEIALKYGDDYSYWSGQSVLVYFDPNVMFGGKKIGGVRVGDADYQPPVQRPRAAHVPQNAPQPTPEQLAAREQAYHQQNGGIPGGVYVPPPVSGSPRARQEYAAQQAAAYDPNDDSDPFSDE